MPNSAPDPASTPPSRRAPRRSTAEKAAAKKAAAKRTRTPATTNASGAKRAPRGARTRAVVVAERLAGEYPGDARTLCALEHADAFQLLVATILSAQCTDEMVNKVTPAVFARYPTPADLAGANPLELEDLVHSTGFFRSKAKNLIGMATALEEDHDGQVPSGLAELVKLPGVGRKTANVVRSVAFDLPGLPVDTHVGRLAVLLGLTDETDPVKAELALNALVPEAERGAFSLRMILHGRAVCDARSPRCGDCLLADVCPSAFRV